MSLKSVESRDRGAISPAWARNDGLAAAIGEAEARYAARNPKSAALFRRAQSVMPGGNTRTALHFDPFPLYIARSSGAMLEDVDGHTYLDVLGEFTAGLFGHSEPQIRQAIASATERGASNGAPGENEIALAELICGRFPSIETVRFCNSGTEANLYAITLAKAYTKRNKLICFSGAYHGGVFVFSGNGSPMNVPFDWTFCRYNDAEGAARTIASIGQELAAVILEPMMSNGGCIPATAAFLGAIRKACTDVGAVLIFDEVVSSRMSAGGLQQVHGVIPDMTTLGKYLGAGFSFGAFGGAARIMDLMDPARLDALPHAGTFNNNVYSMAAGLVGLRDIFTPERAAALYRLGEDLRERLNGLAAEASPCVQFTGCGSVMNIHFSSGPIASPEDLGGESKDLLKLFHLDLLAAGIYAPRRGQFNLSLPMGPEEGEKIVAVVSGFLARRKSLIDHFCDEAMGG